MDHLSCLDYRVGDPSGSGIAPSVALARVHHLTKAENFVLLVEVAFVASKSFLVNHALTDVEDQLNRVIINLVALSFRIMLGTITFKGQPFSMEEIAQNENE